MTVVQLDGVLVLGIDKFLLTFQERSDISDLHHNEWFLITCDFDFFQFKLEIFCFLFFNFIYLHILLL